MEEADAYGENRPPLIKKCEYLGKNRGHANFTKKDPFSAKIRTMMRTLSQREWRDRAFFSPGTLPHTSVSLTRCISIVFSVLNILTHLTTMLRVGSL